MTEVETNEIKISKNDIGKVFKLKKNKAIWSIDIQETICFLTERFVKLECSSWNNKYFFGKIIESNLFGALEKSEVMFSVENIDFSEVYKNPEEFNENKIKALKTFMLI